MGIDLSKYKDNCNFSEFALSILRERYLWKNIDGDVIETPKDMLKRVAEKLNKHSPFNIEEEAFKVMYNLDFLPNSPTLMNAGRKGLAGQLSACYVLPVPDSIDGIYDALKHQALIHKSGGGTGFNFSHLRPKNSIVSTTKGRASGPVSFLEVFDASTGKIMQGGMRRGANMGILNIDHPDIEEFIRSKSEDGRLQNFNISVAVTDKFMSKVLYKEPKAVRLFNLLIESAHATGDPGIIFIDEINRKNTTPHLGNLEATNPCGETPLYPYEACNLGSINLAHMYDEGYNGIDWFKLESTVKIAVRMLDAVIGANIYPLKEIAEAVAKTRKIGLGVMGFADLMFKMSIVYGSSVSCNIGEKLMKFIRETGIEYSNELALREGAYNEYDRVKSKGARRNATITCCAPTGTLSLLAGCSSGVEPVFALTHTRKVFVGTDHEKEETIYHEEYLKAKEIHDSRITKGVFVTAHDIPYSEQIKVQAAFQKHTDLAVSKTINLPNDATKEDVYNCYMEAWMNDCKGVTVYRDGCKSTQILSVKKVVSKCPNCDILLTHEGGCMVCKSCGYSPCAI